jgi:hypothetical protein
MRLINGRGGESGEMQPNERTKGGKEGGLEYKHREKIANALKYDG